MEQGQAHIPGLPPPHVLLGDTPCPPPCGTQPGWEKGSPEGQPVLTRIPWEHLSCSSFHLHNHEGPGDGVLHFCWHSLTLQHWHPIFGMKVPAPKGDVSTLCHRACLAECFPQQLRVHFDLLMQHVPASSSLPLLWHFPYSRGASFPFSLCGTLSPVLSATQAEPLACDGE